MPSSEEGEAEKDPRGTPFAPQPYARETISNGTFQGFPDATLLRDPGLLYLRHFLAHHPRFSLSLPSAVGSEGPGLDPSLLETR